MSVYEFDVLIVGCGIAGLTSAIKLAEAGKNIGILTREQDPKISNTYWAQGGIIYSKDGRDNPEKFSEDIHKASAKTSCPDAVDTLVKRSGTIVEEVLLEKVLTNFQRGQNGDLLFTKEAAHSTERIIYNGDYTGKSIQISLLNFLKDKKRFPNVTFLTSHTAIDLLTPHHQGLSVAQRYHGNKVVGVYAFNQLSSEVHKIMAKVTILATGGVGALYLHHTNAEGARGDGHAMAKRAGALLINMEFVQFHPTTFHDKSSHRRFLISEAVRGEGGVLLNSKGEAFMKRYHHDGELAPRDIVARSIQEEMIATKHDCVYLDVSFKDPSWLRERFPTIFEHCNKYHIDITKDPIPVVPAAHYTCGGIKTDLNGRTSLPNLYAVGEVACTGLHGANRLASTSLLEGLTWGYMAAEDILQTIDKVGLYDGGQLKAWDRGSEEVDKVLLSQDWLTIKQTMWNYVGITRSSNRLKRAQAMFKELSEEVNKFYKHSKLHDDLIGLRNGIEVGQMVLFSSMRNKESVGCFYIND